MDRRMSFNAMVSIEGWTYSSVVSEIAIAEAD
jgi:hypothetical protein